MFFEGVVIEGKSTKAIFDQGSKTKRVIRGTEISNLKPMIICEFEVKSGSVVEVRGQAYRAKDIEPSACGLWTVFLERKHEDRSNYLGEEENSKSS